MELTKEHFDQQLSKLVTKDDLTIKLDHQSADLKSYAADQTEELARMVNSGFEEVKRTP